MHRSTLEPWLGREQPSDFVILTNDWNHSDLLVTQLLNEAGAGSFVFNQDLRARPLFLLLHHRSFEIRKIKAIADQVQQITVVTLNVPHRSNGIIRDLACLHGGVPTDDKDVARLRLRSCPISLQPFALDQISFGWNGPLQVLSREIHQSHSRLQLRQNVARLTDGIKDVVNLATMNLSVPDRDDCGPVRDRGEVEMVPASLLEQNADEIIHMEPLHHDNNDVLALEVEAREQRVLEPLNSRFARRFRHGLFRIHRIVKNEDIASPTGERAADGRCESAAPSRGNRLKLGIFL